MKGGVPVLACWFRISALYRIVQTILLSEEKTLNSLFLYITGNKVEGQKWTRENSKKRGVPVLTCRFRISYVYITKN